MPRRHQTKPYTPCALTISASDNRGKPINGTHIDKSGHLCATMTYLGWVRDSVVCEGQVEGQSHWAIRVYNRPKRQTTTSKNNYIANIILFYLFYIEPLINKRKMALNAIFLSLLISFGEQNVSPFPQNLKHPEVFYYIKYCFTAPLPSLWNSYNLK